MNTQINLRLPEKILLSAKKHAQKNGFSNVQEFIKELLREKLFEKYAKVSEKEMVLIEKLIKLRETHPEEYVGEKELKKIFENKGIQY
jgi:Arc/MetJ-type ribon-helix-helix transcriptional regulator